MLIGDDLFSEMTAFYYKGIKKGIKWEGNERNEISIDL